MDEPKPIDETYNAMPPETTPDMPNPDTSNAAASSEDKSAAHEGTPVEKALDFAFGVGLLTGESLKWLDQRLNEAATQMQEQAPDFINDMQMKGKPIREQVLANLQNNVFAPLKTAADDLKKEAEPVVPQTNLGKNSDMPAEQEIQRLEDRVKELEQQLQAKPEPKTEDVAPESDIWPDAPKETDGDAVNV